jgi:DMSO/TMAO reductase YedYZ molybdopterin-dependent catalytic subunit
MKAETADVIFWGVDHGLERGEEHTFARSLKPDTALRDEVLLAHAMNGAPLEPQHGYPLRLIVPGWYGMTSVKWLSRITASTARFDGYQQARAYRFRADPDEPGTAVTRMHVRSLMVPPGIPDFLTRGRFVRPGPVLLEGRAWSGFGAVASVEVSVDGGRTWAQSDLDAATVPHAWQAWRHPWQAAVGAYDLRCRATDTAGNVQPLEHSWNLGGYAVNTVQHVQVTVTRQPPDV